MKEKCVGEIFFHIVHHVWEDQEVLEISDSDFKKIMELKVQAKKDMIMGQAAVEAAGVDIMSALWLPVADVAGINKLIDRKFELKKETVKKLVGAMLALKEMFSAKQMKKLKELCRSRQCMAKGKESAEQTKPACS